MALLDFLKDALQIATYSTYIHNIFSFNNQTDRPLDDYMCEQMIASYYRSRI